MARRNRENESPTEVTEAEVTTPVEEAAMSEVTDTPAEVEASDSKAEKKEKAPIDLTAFNAAVASAIEAHDSATGNVPEESLAAVTTAYRELDGLAPKNAAKKVINDSMRESMNEMNLTLARAYMVVADSLTAGSTGPKEKVERTPVDPTEAFVQSLAVVGLANELIAASRPEGVSDDYTSQLETVLAEARDGAKVYTDWLNREPVAEGAEDAPEPEVSAVAKAAVKLSLGKSAKLGGTKPKSGGSTYTGERRDIGKHIAEAFEGKEVGTFLTVAEIRNFASSEYDKENPPSAGAISARLFPTSGKCTVENVEPGTNEKGNRGARKVA